VTQNLVSYWEKPSLTQRQRRLFHARRFTLAGHFCFVLVARRNLEQG
jgi:hypothetical protein